MRGFFFVEINYTELYGYWINIYICCEDKIFKY
jgi:hypothetical protein